MKSSEILEVLLKVSAEALTAYHEALLVDGWGDIVGNGADREPTTRIDNLLESAVVRSLESAQIGGEILSEEIGKYRLKGPNRPILFMIDPLDGTTNALSGIHYYALSIAAFVDGQLTAGVVVDYSSKDVFSAAKGEGAFLNKKKIKVTSVNSLAKATLALSRPMFKSEMPFYSELFLAAKRIRILSCPALETVLVASGSVAAFIDYHQSAGLIGTHDVIAGRLILEEAGGMFLDEQGNSPPVTFDLVTKFNVFAVANRAIFDAIINIKNQTIGA